MLMSPQINATENRFPKQIKSLICALKHRDYHTELHSQRVINLSTNLGYRCGLSAVEIDRLRISAYLHDIGKIGIPDRILLKPGKLDAEEWNYMKTHPEKGEEITQMLDIEDCDLIANVVRQHHEYYDGSGYPDQLSGENISILARIIAIADAYDAITETRPYSPAKSHHEAIEIINFERGIKFDPDVFQKFLKMIDQN
ncbi:MAG: HD-GYP domain-containing protein [Halothece sp. Uz-M2-17]|nr:HD-GYP domain-containing protein [Halothece sp. Uz-M2-17]